MLPGEHVGVKIIDGDGMPGLKGPTDETERRMGEWLDWICQQEIRRRGVLPDLAERARLREKLRPTAKRIASGDRRAFTDLVRLYGKVRQAPPDRSARGAVRQRQT